MLVPNTEASRMHTGNSLSQDDEYLVLLDGNQISSEVILYIIDDAAEHNTVSDNAVGVQTLNSSGCIDVKGNGNTIEETPKNIDRVVQNQLINVSQPQTCSTDVSNNVGIQNEAVSLKSSEENVPVKTVIPDQTLISFHNDVSTSNDKTLSTWSTVNNTKPLGDSSVITTKAQITDIHSIGEITNSRQPPPPVSVVNTCNADTMTVSSLQKNFHVIDADKAGNKVPTLMKTLPKRSSKIGCVSEMGSSIVEISTVKQPLTTKYTSNVNTEVGDSSNEAVTQTGNSIISKKQATGNTSCTSNIAPIIHVTKPQTGINTMSNGSVSNDKMKTMCQTSVCHKPSNQNIHIPSPDNYIMFLPGNTKLSNSKVSQKPEKIKTITHSTAKKHSISGNKHHMLSTRKDCSPAKKIFKQDLTKAEIVKKLSECISKISLECFDFHELIELSGNLRFEIDNSKEEIVEIKCSVSKHKQSLQDRISKKSNKKIVEKNNVQGQSTDGKCSISQTSKPLQDQILNETNEGQEEKMDVQGDSTDVDSSISKLSHQIKIKMDAQVVCSDVNSSISKSSQSRSDAISNKLNQKVAEKMNTKKESIDESTPVPVLMFFNTNAENETQATDLSKIVEKTVLITSEQAPTATGQLKEKCNFCPFCDVFFPDTSTTQSHLKEHATTNENYCKQCNESFLSQEAFFAHSMNKHSTTINKLRGITGSLQCLICNTGKQFNTPNDLLRHFQSHRPTKDFACDICGKMFQYEISMKAHKKGLHGKQKPYKCEKCGETFSFPNSYKNHMTKHLGLQLACDQCDKIFSTLQNLREHKNRHDNTKRFTCEFCGKNFSYRQNFNSHLLTHLRIKPFICTICGKGYSDKWQCTKHEKQHDGKRFPCDICGKSFQTKEWMKFHQRRHLGDFNIFCEICGRGFMHKSKLQVHLKTHKTLNGDKFFSDEFFL